MTKIKSIHQWVQQQGEVPFVQYMQQALYGPDVGYYTSGLPKLGEKGDFTTAPELTPLFGKTLAYQCQQVLADLQNPVLFEFGAGTGRLCVDILTGLEQLNALPQAYHILEVSSHLRFCQQEYIKQKRPDLLPLIQWHTTWPQQAFNGVFIANEVLDAMPVHRFMLVDDGLLESYITIDDHGALTESFKPCENEDLIHHVAEVIQLQYTPYLSEANLFLNHWMKPCFEMLEQGAFFIIDYGFPRQEYYHPDRNQGTLMCHYQHHTHTNVLAHPGAEDITAHVDFTHVAEAAFAAGFHVAGFANQASFLLANGFLSLLNEVEGTRERLKAQQASKLLLQESEMGELFKVLGLTKSLDLDLNGFLMQDKRASL